MGTTLKTAYMLTAGVGSRLAPHTDHLPKPSLPFLGLPLLYYGFFLAQKAGFKQFLFNLHHLPDHLKKTTQGLKSFIEHTHYSDEIKTLLGSGGAIWNAKNKLKEQDYFLIANGDEVLIPKDEAILNQLLKQFQKDDSLCTLLVCDHPELLKTLKPAWINDQNQVLGFGMKKPSSSATPKHYTGYKIFSSRIFNFLPEGSSNIFYDVLIKAIADGEKITTFHIDSCDWHETGNFDSFVKASRTVLQENFSYIQKLHQFYGKPDLEILKNNDHLLLKPKNLNLPSSFKYSGVVCLDSHSEIGENVHLHNCFSAQPIQLSNIDIKNEFL